LLKDIDADGARKSLGVSAGRIRGFLGREMHIRQIPELHFIFDDSELKARNIDALIDRVIGEDSRGKP
jgi:ribosome-binding factor A